LDGEEFGIVEWIDKPVIQDRLLSVLKGVVGRTGRTRLKVLHVEDDPIFSGVHQLRARWRIWFKPRTWLKRGKCSPSAL